MKYETRFAEFADEKVSPVQGIFQGQAAAKIRFGHSNGSGIATVWGISCANSEMVSSEVGTGKQGSRKSHWLPGQSE